MVVKALDNLCVICGAVLPEGRQVCPICGMKDNIEGYAQLIRKPNPPEFKVDDTLGQAFRQGYLTGFNEGMKAACELKQQNAQLRKDNAILRAAIERRDNENNQDGWYE